jgi:hypothetical protein
VAVRQRFIWLHGGQAVQTHKKTPPLLQQGAAKKETITNKLYQKAGVMSMCFYCRQSLGHHPSCPFAEEPEHIFDCDECGMPIYVDEKYLEVRGEIFCEKCYEDMLKYAEKEIK